MIVRSKGHIKFKESASEWEMAWIGIYASEGFGYRFVASLVYGIPVSKVTESEIARVGRIARRKMCGCKAYRTGQSSKAFATVKSLNSSHKDMAPPKISIANVRSAFKNYAT